jgi:hypothetical protein
MKKMRVCNGTATSKLSSTRKFGPRPEQELVESIVRRPRPVQVLDEVAQLGLYPTSLLSPFFIMPTTPHAQSIQ